MTPTIGSTWRDLRFPGRFVVIESIAGTQAHVRAYVRQAGEVYELPMRTRIRIDRLRPPNYEMDDQSVRRSECHGYTGRRT